MELSRSDDSEDRLTAAKYLCPCHVRRRIEAVWQALYRLHEADADGNTVVGSHVGIDTKGSIIHSQPGHTIVTIDVDDLIVVQTADATLVAPKRAEERIREAVKALEERKLDQLL